MGLPFWSAGLLTGDDWSGMEPLPCAPGGCGVVASGRHSTERDVARLTAERLSNPQIDHLYALHAARIRFVPFQLKPLLRFLHADQPRLLIADEVGVGKTIEAGLILRELQARQQVGNVLIVCPKALVTKWRAEMLRFDEQFVPLDSQSLRYCVRQAHLDGAWPQQYSRAIIHLELMRGENHLIGEPDKEARPGLLTLNPPPAFSLTIIDEAHHLRNPETRSPRAGPFPMRLVRGRPLSISDTGAPRLAQSVYPA
jgi:ATP-dependent helicase HepA